MKKLSSVLLVDDDPTTNFLHRRLLTRLAVSEHILVAQDGAQALAMLAAAPAAARPALILLDVNMPGMSGLDFLAAYQRLPAAERQAPVVMVTTSADPQELRRSQELGSVGIVTKPLTAEKVADIWQLLA